MSGYRRAAAALYGVDSADRAAVLAELSHDDQVRLEGLLAELKSLGFSRSAAAGVAGDDMESAQERLSLADPDELYQILAREPDVLTAQLLLVCAWPWRAALLGLFSPARRSVILALRPIPAPALHEVMLTQLAAHLPHRAAVAGRPWRAWSFVRGWGRK